MQLHALEKTMVMVLLRGQQTNGKQKWIENSPDTVTCLLTLMTTQIHLKNSLSLFYILISLDIKNNKPHLMLGMVW